MTRLETWTEDLAYSKNTRLSMRLCGADHPPVIEISLADTEGKDGSIRHNSVTIPVQAIKKLLKGHLD
jgi:hypothetical protein